MTRWRKEPKRKGLAGIAHRSVGWDLVSDGVIVACVRPVGGGRWYWHTTGTLPFRNTAICPSATAEAAKQEALEYVRASGSLSDPAAPAELPGQEPRK